MTMKQQQQQQQQQTARADRHHRHCGEEEDEKYEEGEEEEEQEEAESEGDDCFFESFDRVASRVSFCLDLPSDSDDDEEDDVRISFASAVGPPCDLRCVTFSREEFLAQHRDEDEGHHQGRGPGGYDYDVWMAEPISIKERRRRLLQGMGFASKRDLAASLRIRSISRKAVDAPAVNGDQASESLPPLPPLPPLPAPQSPVSPEAIEVAASPDTSTPPPAITRCRSDTELATRGSPPLAEPTLTRAASAPPTLWDNLARETPEAAGDDGVAGADDAEALVLASGEVCRIENPDTGNEFVVSECDKDGKGRLNDIPTGLQITMEDFERFLGYSPIVKELMRRVKLGGGQQRSSDKAVQAIEGPKNSKPGYRKKGGWFKNIKFVASSVTGLITEKEKGDAGSKVTGKSPGDNSSELMKVRQHGKSYRELTGLYMSQEIDAHQGSIWSIKFSWDGRFLASAGEDRVVHVWQVQECDIHSTSLRRQESRTLPPSKPDGSPDGSLPSTQPLKKTKKTKSKKRSLPDYINMPEVIFSLSEKPVCSFEGHSDDVLDLSWSKSQHLLSSSMDKTVRLWDMETKSCLRLFAHNDYVTCIQFNPIDDRYFISGSLDAKVRIWSVPDRQVVDWTDLHEMVTAACYTPDGQGALVGSHKGSFRLYKTTDCKLSQESQIDIQNKKKKTNAKKITGFQFAPGNPSEVLITSADSQVRVFDDLKMVHKFRGFRNTSSQMSASYTSDGRYVICASEDSHVYVWKREANAGKSKGLSTTRSHEHFYCKDVSVAIPWPNARSNCSPLSPPPMSGRFIQQEPLGSTDSQRSTATLDDIFPSGSNSSPPLPKKSDSELTQSQAEELSNISLSGAGIGSESFASASSSMRASDPGSSSLSSWGWYSGGSTRSGGGGDQPNAWGLVVVTAGLGGDIRIYQNFGLPLRLSRQTNLF
ncbi:uncharacterized protein LOC135607387 [Musa acuminata AAA Group]|uniref:uncharacterized protein LOC135607387 n=1 Tax=Musa acuminata AAA Group TaxID=214697 RepID=UPI0031DF610B